jgi:hypothetical protein
MGIPALFQFLLKKSNNVAIKQISLSRHRGRVFAVDSMAWVYNSLKETKSTIKFAELSGTVGSSENNMKYLSMTR